MALAVLPASTGLCSLPLPHPSDMPGTYQMALGAKIREAGARVQI